jgi:hypothetical protein
MKKNCFLLVALFYTLRVYSQTLPPKAVIIAPGANNIHEVQGNIKASGLVESNSLKAAALATGDYQIVRPVYANAEGSLITGYKTGYLSIPPAAFRRSIDIYMDGGTTTYLGSDMLFYSGSILFFAQPSSNRVILAPVQLPHNSKLNSLKITFFSPDKRYIEGAIIRASLNGYSSETSIFTFTTPTTNNSVVTAEFPIDLIEMDNQNYIYTLQLKSPTNEWFSISIRGVGIEYRDF